MHYIKEDNSVHLIINNNMKQHTIKVEFNLLISEGIFELRNKETFEVYNLTN